MFYETLSCRAFQSAKFTRHAILQNMDDSAFGCLSREQVSCIFSPFVVLKFESSNFVSLLIQPLQLAELGFTMDQVL
jgi:hypothetical protein